MDMLNKAAQAVPVDLVGPTVVNLTPSELLSVEQAGDDLLLQLANGDAISVERFFAQEAEQPILWLVDEQDELVQLNLATTPQGELQADFMPLGESAALGDAAVDVTQGLQPAFGSSAGGASMGAAAGTGGMSPAMGLAIFGGIAATGVAIAENSSSSSSSSARPTDDGDMNDAGPDVTGYVGLQQAIDGVADFIDADIGEVTVAIGQLLGEDFSAAMVSAESRDAAMEAVQGLSAASDEAALVAAAEAITDLVVANRIAIAENFAQLLPEVDIAEAAAAIAADVEAGLAMPEGLNAAEQAVFETLVAVQTNGAIVEALLEAANATYELGLDVPEYMAPMVPEMADLESLLAAATDSVAAVGALAVPSVAAIAEIIDGLLAEQEMAPGDDAGMDDADMDDAGMDDADMDDAGMDDAGPDVTGYAGLQQAIDGVADFIDADIGEVTVAIGQLLGEDFGAAMVSAESRDAAMEAVQGLSAASDEAALVAAAEAITDLVVANRIAIAENFAQLLPEVDIAEAAAAIAADVEAGLAMPEGLNAAEQAVFETLVAVQTNGAIVEALLEAANSTYELGLDVPEYMAPMVPEMADLESLLAAATDSVAAVGALAVPSVAAIAEIVDGLLAEQGEENSGEENHVPGLTFGFIDTDASVNADLSDSANATQINVALVASGLAPMIAGATDNNADGTVGLNLDASGAELDTLAIDASGDASRFNFGVANNGAVIDTTVVTGDADLFLNLTNSDGYRLEMLDASAASGDIILVNGGPAVQDKRLEFGDGDVLYVTASGNLNGSDIINMGGGHNAVETHFREGGIKADYQANVDAINAGSGIATFILDAWLDDAGGPLEMKVSDFDTVRDFIFDDTHAGGMANVQDTLSNDIKVGDVSDDSTFFVRALTDDGVMQSYMGAEDALMLNLTLAGADAGAAARVASDLAVNNIEVADATGTFNARFALEDGAELNLGGKVSGGDGVVNVAAGGGFELTLDASGLNSQAMIDASTNAAGAVVSVSGSANGLALESAGTVIGSDQSDLIFGSSGADVMTGGGGADVFHISTMASGQGGSFFLAADADIVTDFSVADGDLLAFSGLDASHSADGGPLFGSGDTYLVGGEAANFAEARLIASQGLEDSGVFFVAAEVDGSTFIFAQEGDNAGTIGQVVKLKDVGLDELDGNGHFIAGEVDLDDEALMLLSDDDALIMEGEQEDGMAEMPQEASAGDMVGMTEIMAMPAMEEIHAVM